ncbi:TonB-dependent siderophore receptor [Pseudomonas nicosulfuronedens]|uniref:TonB-dependent siderophore receptor n=2 Tax=Pseudomonas nicosulfuronedens TaxID=2571105 RepID=A0A5R9R004_9PSED|nr:TonB-dependent siderophore receptor [Pseudomonas nicosulfuronedens]MDH1011829.1 TonB-dependent siderophore receptor [Pseudomonas nicosulfuronedens]MDH1980678.1 TonB-dependent siderophore receptor [Pseudomonas nicosulfuronedens]MDH2030275.1 TonB-dependent siderophore receptor [Pseudomonas nicosulfuronedens]TLX75860.1 TonB-dependent siderophore receptor [Pseudomonas nicosulfuronedens]
MESLFTPNRLALAMVLSFQPLAVMAADAEIPGDVVEFGETVVTAEQEAKQALGSSVITAEDIERHPPANDLSEIIRRQPGVNLTGNSASGARGNNRQIDLRGMGPENTLILIDGKPSSSRNAVRYGWNGDRDTRGDTNWVPAEAVERIEILRGPAAARYGSGAMGGVVNIITKRPSEELKGQVSLYTLMPEDKAEGASQRANFNLSGALADNLTFRTYGGLSKTDADDLDINADQAKAALPAGREGVRNKDIDGLLSWRVNDEHTLELSAGYGRQGNIYAGDTMNSNGGGDIDYISSLYGHETNVIQRSTWDLTHLGHFDWGTTKSSLNYEYVRNWRMNEGLAGGPEGSINDTGAAMSRLRNTRASSEVNLPLAWGETPHMLTLGGEYLYESLNDQGSFRPQSFDPSNGSGDAIAGFDRSDSKMTASSNALFVEDNIQYGDTTLTPGLRFDHHNQFGDNWSPSLNLAHQITDALSIKGGIARAYKTPNLYQSNPNYLLYSRGNGCSVNQTNSGGCYLVGNADLKPETSINKEIGLLYDKGDWRVSGTYFRNDYKNKIIGGTDVLYTINSGRRVTQWVNADKALVEGVEGNFFVELTPTLDWNTNLTVMMKNDDRDTGEPLSVIPKYTVNTTLDWQATDQLSFQLAGTYYGKQESPSYNYRLQEDYDEAAQQDLDPYGLVDVSAGYAFTRNYKVRVGVNNVFDKQIYREGNASSAGASTYNQPGRALFAAVDFTF